MSDLNKRIASWGDGVGESGVRRMSELRKQIDWTRWQLCRIDLIQDALLRGKDPTPAQQQNNGIRYYMKPLQPSLPSPIDVPAFFTEQEAMQWVIDGGKEEVSSDTP